jgi:two-component system sensor histidine kinase QseC
MPSIHRQLVVILLIAFVLIWSGVAAITYANVRAQVETRSDEQLAQTAEVLWLLYSAPRAGGAGTMPREDAYAHRIISRFGINYAFQVWDSRELLARSANAPETGMADGYGPSAGTIGDVRWRFYYRVDALRGLDVIVGNVQADRNRVVWSLVLGTVWPLLAGLPLLAMLIIGAVARGLRPLRAVAESLSDRRPDTLEPITEDGVPREITPLTRALNELLARVQSAITGERRFTANASHELRTPLAALKTQAQLALRADSEVTRSKALEGMVAGVDRATRLIEQLLTLARLDPDSTLDAAEPMDISRIAADTVAAEKATARARHVDLRLRATKAILIGQPAAVSVLLRNLVDNAVRHCPPGALVEVLVETTDESVILTVSDDGPGIPRDDREQVYDRFYRRMGQSATGSGLGLSIVARVAEVHGATIELEDARTGPAAAAGRPGLRVRVAFPRH